MSDTKKPEMVPATPAPALSPDQQRHLARQRYRTSRGGQVVLHPDSDAALAARGGAGSTIEENTYVRDKALVEADCDPRDPDASHLPENTVPAGGDVMKAVEGATHAPKYQPKDAVPKA